MNYLLLFLLSVTHITYAQTVSFRELKFKPKPELYDTKVPTIIYPIIIVNNKSTGKFINDEIKREIMGEDVVNIRQAFKERINEGLTDMDYEVTLINHGILSLTINETGCGAYCSGSHTYFNFDLRTGKSISIHDLLDENRIDSFTKILYADKIRALNKYKDESNYYDDKTDSATVNWAIEQVNENCISKVTIDNFSLSKDTIEIMDPCEFPHAIRALEPDYKLRYSYRFLLPFLKPKYRRLFVK